MSAIIVVEHLRKLAEDPANRATIVKDQGCLSGLVLFLDNNDPNVIKTALEALNFLADYPPNRANMKDEIGLVVSLKTIMNKQDGIAVLQGLAREVYNKVGQKQRRAAHRPASRMVNNSNNKSFFLGASNRKAKLVVLQIKGLTNLVSRKQCEQQMLKTRGVISFTFDMGKSRMIVRCKHDITPETLVQKVNETKLLQAEQVVKNESGEEVMLSFGMGPSSTCRDKSGNSSALPDYLPEEDEMDVADNAVAKVGDNKENNTGWFGSVTSFLNKSLYW